MLFGLEYRFHTMHSRLNRARQWGSHNQFRVAEIRMCGCCLAVFVILWKYYLCRKLFALTFPRVGQACVQLVRGTIIQSYIVGALGVSHYVQDFDGGVVLLVSVPPVRGDAIGRSFGRAGKLGAQRINMHHGC